MRFKEDTDEMFGKLDAKYGVVKTFLDHGSPFQLLVAVILSAQTTDTTVNKVTPKLFEKYPDNVTLKNASIDDVLPLINKVNYYRTKAKNLIEMSRIIDERFNGVVPKTIEELVLLPGVGRKVANVIMADIYGNAVGVVVDTHVKRVSYRVGWTDERDPKKIEIDLMREWPDTVWVNGPKQIILIGRQFCFANKKPDCLNCPLNKNCWKRVSHNIEKI